MRRFLAAVGIVVILALAMTLLWRVYVHHVRISTDESIISL